jgi:hypothetical protein
MVIFNANLTPLDSVTCVYLVKTILLFNSQGRPFLPIGHRLFEFYANNPILFMQ